MVFPEGANISLYQNILNVQPVNLPIENHENIYIDICTKLLEIMCVVLIVVEAGLADTRKPQTQFFQVHKQVPMPRAVWLADCLAAGWRLAAGCWLVAG